MQSFFGFTREELADELEARGRRPPAEARRLFRAVYRDGVKTWSDLPRVPHRVRRWLTQEVSLDEPRLVCEESADDGTRRLHFELGDAARAEVTLVPRRLDPGPTSAWVALGLRYLTGGAYDELRRGDAVTACLCSQVGCPLACRSPSTAEQSAKRRLRPEEMVALVVATRRIAPVHDLVIRGRGQPLHSAESVTRACRILSEPAGLHYAPDRIAVSTCGE